MYGGLKRCRLPSKDGLLDWDCAEAIDVPAMADALTYIRQHGAFPASPRPPTPREATTYR